MSAALSRQAGNSTTTGSSTKPQQLQLTDYLRPVFQEAQLVREYCQFAGIQQSQGQSTDVSGGGGGGQEEHLKSLPGVYVIPSAQSVYTWFGLLTIPSTYTTSSSSSPYPGAHFRFHLKFPESYPTHPPSIHMAPINAQLKHLSTHPDVNPATGLYSMKHTSHGSGSSNRTYKILKLFRKSFYQQRHETTADDHQEYAGRCAAEAADSVRCVNEIDAYLGQRFLRDPNLILLGGDNHHQHHHGDREMLHGQQRAGGDNNARASHIGLSFMM